MRKSLLRKFFLASLPLLTVIIWWLFSLQLVFAQTPVLLFQEIRGTSNPGTFTSTNLTMAGGTNDSHQFIDGAYITGIDIQCTLNSGSAFTVTMNLQEFGSSVQTASQTCPSGTNWISFDFSSSPYLVADIANFTIRPTRQTSEGNGFPRGFGASDWNVRYYGYFDSDSGSSSPSSTIVPVPLVYNDSMPDEITCDHTPTSSVCTQTYIFPPDIIFSGLLIFFIVFFGFIYYFKRPVQI